MIEAVRWYGQRTLLVECRSLAEVMALHHHVEQNPLEGQREAVAGARSVMIDFRSRRAAMAAMRQIRRLKPRPAPVSPRDTVEVPVYYDGEDCAAAAQALNLSPEAMIRWHTSTPWVAAFTGFAPGFTYCVPEQMARRKRPRRADVHPPVPRRAEPRAEVPAGAVALAGEFSAVYPRHMPGSWQVIGRTSEAFFDPKRPHPALLNAGDTVQYVAQTERIQLGHRPAHRQIQAPRRPAVEVLDAGVLTVVQDGGRRGFSHQGVPRSGSADSAAARQANQLVGNEDSAAVFETVWGGLELTAHQTVVVAVTGADVSVEVTTPVPRESSNMALNGTGAVRGEPQDAGTTREVPARAPFWLAPGERMRVLEPSRGMRSYVAISGGLDAPQCVGSSSTDIRSQVGPAPVHAGDAFGLVGVTSRFVGIADVARTALPDPDMPTVLRCVPGPAVEHFAQGKAHDAGMVHLQSVSFSVSSESDRAGLRLSSNHDSPLAHRMQDTAETPVMPMPLIPGAVQIRSNGEPVLLLPDHPVTGGLPVLAVVVREDLGLAAQLPPGSQVRFQTVDPDTLSPR